MAKTVKRSPTAHNSRGRKNIQWIEKYCNIPEGSQVGNPVKLRRWQMRELCKIYNNKHTTRLAIISFGRKNGKTALAAFLLLLHLCGREARPNSQLYSSAQSKEQAAVIFELAAKIVRMSPALREIVQIKDTWKHLTCLKIGTKYRALSAEASTAHGLSPVFCVHDELGRVRGPRSDMYEALETATAAHENPLSVIISTQAPTDADLMSVLMDDAIDGQDPSVVVSLYTAPQEADPFAEATVRMANPAYGDFLNKEEVQKMAENAKRMPSGEAAYRNLVLNQRVEASSPFVSRSVWRLCGAEPKPLDGIPVYAGLDLSSTRDLTALVLMGWIDGVWHIHPFFWLPGDGLTEKAASDRVPYDMWRDQGHLLTAPGKSVDYEYVAQYLAEAFTKYDIRKIGFDRWGMQHLRPWLIKAGIEETFIDERFSAFGQGTQSMSPALRVLEGEILNQRLAHGNQPVLAMCFSNAVVEGKDESCRKLSKAKSSGRIDGAVATAMAFGVAPLGGEEPEYQMIII